MNILKTIEKHGLTLGRMVGYSKSFYRKENPENDVVFNANIFVESAGKVWWGDLDLTKSEERLKAIAAEINEPLYILREHDGRFGKESLSVEEMKTKAHKTICPSHPSSETIQDSPLRGLLWWIKKKKE